MKKIVFWLALIVGILALIGSCAKKDEESSTAATGGCGSLTTVSACSSTPSGSITGIDNTTLTGVFSTMHVYGILGTPTGIDNSTDCISNASLLSSLGASVGMPTGAQGLIMNYAVTSSSSFSQRVIWYSDTSCSTEVARFSGGNNDVTVGDQVTGLTAKVGSKTYLTTASKVTYSNNCFEMKGSTDAGITWLKTFLSGVNPTVGTTYTCTNSDPARYALMHLDNTTSSYGMSLFWEESSSAQPTAWSSNTDTLTFLP